MPAMLSPGFMPGDNIAGRIVQAPVRNRRCHRRRYDTVLRE
jgi:hypothetical protein